MAKESNLKTDLKNKLYTKSKIRNARKPKG